MIHFFIVVNDFVIELTTWFRRAIWFLAFTSATTLSPGLFLVAAALGLVFELVYNITNARRYWDTVVGYDGHDKGNINMLMNMIRLSKTMNLNMTTQAIPIQYQGIYNTDYFPDNKHG